MMVVWDLLSWNEGRDRECLDGDPGDRGERGEASAVAWKTARGGWGYAACRISSAGFMSMVSCMGVLVLERSRGMGESMETSRWKRGHGREFVGWYYRMRSITLRKGFLC